MKHWKVCEKCGRTIAATQAAGDGWLVAPYIRDVSVEVVRCYEHITESALRRSFAGRTNHWLTKMKEGRERAAKERRLHPFYEPFPTEDKP